MGEAKARKLFARGGELIYDEMHNQIAGAFRPEQKQHNGCAFHHNPKRGKKGALLELNMVWMTWPDKLATRRQVEARGKFVRKSAAPVPASSSSLSGLATCQPWDLFLNQYKSCWVTVKSRRLLSDM